MYGGRDARGCTTHTGGLNICIDDYDYVEYYDNKVCSETQCMLA